MGSSRIHTAFRDVADDHGSQRGHHLFNFARLQESSEEFQLIGGNVSAEDGDKQARNHLRSEETLGFQPRGHFAELFVVGDPWGE